MAAEPVSCTGESHAEHGGTPSLWESSWDEARVATVQGCRGSGRGAPCAPRAGAGTCGVESVPSWSSGFPAPPPQSPACVTRLCCRDNARPDNAVGLGGCGAGGTAATLAAVHRRGSRRMPARRGRRSACAHQERSAAAGKGKRRCRCPWGCGGEAAAYGLALGASVVRRHQL